MTLSIDESGMSFGPYPRSQCFHIEKSKLYQQLGDGIKTSEFILLRDQNTGRAVWLIEAKSSSPHPKTQLEFDKFIAEIVQKMSNTLHILLATLLERHENTNELSDEFRSLDLKSTPFKCVLVINRHKESWLPPLQEALGKALRPLVKTMSLGTNPIAVMNEVEARKYGLIH